MAVVTTAEHLGCQQSFTVLFTATSLENILSLRLSGGAAERTHPDAKKALSALTLDRDDSQQVQHLDGTAAQ